METPKRPNAETPEHRNVAFSRNPAGVRVTTPEHRSDADPSPVGHEGVPAPRAPEDLPVDPGEFWSAAISLDDLDAPANADAWPALKRLGPLPSARGGFPIMGFLATVYEQIANHAKETTGEGTPAES